MTDTKETTTLGALTKVTSALDPEKARQLIALFEGFITTIQDWEGKAHAIVIKDRNQVGDMMMARTARLFLRGERVKIENIRKELKKPNIAEGKAIEGLANLLKDKIEPIEKYLLTQENFAKDLDKLEAERVQKIVEDKIMADRLEQDRKDAEEFERLAKIERDRIAALEAENKRLREKVEVFTPKVVVGDPPPAVAAYLNHANALSDGIGKDEESDRTDVVADFIELSVMPASAQPEPFTEVKSVEIVCPHCQKSFHYGELKADGEKDAPF